MGTLPHLFRDTSKGWSGPAIQRDHLTIFPDSADAEVSKAHDRFLDPLPLALVFGVKAHGLIGPARRTQVRGREINWAQAYKRRMRRFNLEVISVGLIALTISIASLLIAWGAFSQ